MFYKYFILIVVVDQKKYEVHHPYYKFMQPLGWGDIILDGIIMEYNAAIKFDCKHFREEQIDMDDDCESKIQILKYNAWYIVHGAS